MTGMTGHIAQISISQGGVPKMAISRAEVSQIGLLGDRQKTPGIHGGPEKALCLWSLEVIETLCQEGHRIAPGYAGENITIAGLDWSKVVPGMQLKLGDTVRVEISSYADPCRKNMRWFSDRRYSRISQKHYPGSSRVYARVLEPGLIQTRDVVHLYRKPDDPLYP